MDSKAVTIEVLDLQEVQKYRDQILEVYHRAFSPPPYEHTETDVLTFSASLNLHMKHKDFRCVVARAGELLEGFAYGYTSLPGQWWHDTVTRGLEPQYHQRWFTYAFEFVELAVIPSAQGRGIGGRLHDLLLEDLPHQTAVLTTLDQDTPARHLYRKRGWLPIRNDLNFIGSRKKILVMGLDLEKKEE